MSPMIVDSIAHLGSYSETVLPKLVPLRENYRVGSSVSRDASLFEGTEHLRRAVRTIRSPLDPFRGLQDGWDGGRGIAPNLWALATAERVLEGAQAEGLQEDRVVPLPDGGIVLYFFGKDLTGSGAKRFVARLAFDNEGAATLLLEDVAEKHHSLTDEDPEGNVGDLLDRIRGHISG